MALKCTCSRTELFDAIVENAWFAASTTWSFDFRGLSRDMSGQHDRSVDVEDLLALFVGVRIPVVAKQLTRRNRNRLLDMPYEKQLCVILEIVARGLLS